MITSRRDDLLQRLATNAQRLQVLAARTSTPDVVQRIHQAQIWNRELETDVLRATPRANKEEDDRLWEQLSWQVGLTEALVRDVNREQEELT